MKNVIWVAIALVLGVAGYGIGAVTNSHQSQLSAERATAANLQRKLTSAHDQLTTAHDNLVAAESEVQQAQQTARDAQDRAQAKFAAREKALRKLERRLKSEEGQIQASSISASGVYVVGSDIQPGVYHTNGGADCYFATLSSTNTFDIIDNNNFDGPETVDVSGAHAFDIDGGCTWTREG
jgi:multidrug resistance efflux pump